MTTPTVLSHGRIDAIPLIHGRLAFAIEVRRRMLDHRYDAVAVELPESLAPQIEEALGDLPVASVVVYREVPPFQAEEAEAYYVPVQPADGIIEALRMAVGERRPRYYIDAEVEGFEGRGVTLPDPHALHGLGLPGYAEACSPVLRRHRRHRRGAEDELRESHMAARLRQILGDHSGRVLLVCGLAHWDSIRRHLEHSSGRLHPGEGIPADWVTRFSPTARSIPFLMGETPYVVERYEAHRSGIELGDFDTVGAIKQLLIDSRDLLEVRFPGSLERPDPHALRTLLDLARKMTVRKGQLIPDGYTLTVAANGVVGNDFALTLMSLAHEYRHNGGLELRGYGDVDSSADLVGDPQEIEPPSGPG